MNDTALAVYLNDHLALMTSEVELLERVKDENSGSDLAASLVTFTEAVCLQRDRVQKLIESTGGSVNSIKQAVGWMAEKLGRLKPNDGSTQYTNLARVVELETLMGLSFTRQTMWAALKGVEMQFDLNPDERADAEEQARTQLDSLRERHECAISDAFIERSSKV